MRISQAQSQKTSKERSQTSSEGCEKCDYTGTINTSKWVESSFLDKYGKPMKVEVMDVVPCSCLRDKQFQKYNAASNFSDKEKTHLFKNAVIDSYNAEAFEKAVNFVETIDERLKTGDWIYIHGDDLRAYEAELSAYGTGKTYLMQCIANALSQRHVPVIYVKETALFGDIKSTYNKNSEESETEVLNKYYYVPVLMIDDIFSAQYKDWAEDRLFSILDERAEKGRVTIMTSNYALERIRQRLPINGGKIASRINGKCGEGEKKERLIEMIGPDRR